jgi:hypothetical protein
LFWGSFLVADILRWTKSIYWTFPLITNPVRLILWH